MAAPPSTIIETPRLILRRFRDDDLPTLLAYRNDPEVARYQGWDAMSDAEGRAFIAQMAAAKPGTPGEWFQVAAELKETGEHAGDCGLYVEPDDPRLGEIGYTIARAHQGRGLGTELAAGVVAYAFATLGLHRVVANTDVRNTPSVRLLERLGFRREGHFLQSEWWHGEWTDNYLYALLEREWQGRR